MSWPPIALSWAEPMADFYGFDEYPKAIQTGEGSVVANVMLRELREAMGYPEIAMPITPRELWERTLDEVRSGRDVERVVALIDAVVTSAATLWAALDSLPALDGTDEKPWAEATHTLWQALVALDQTPRLGRP